MVMSLYKANEWLEKYERIVSYSDIVYTPNAIELLKEDNSEISILSEDERNKLDMTSLLNKLLSKGIKIPAILYDDLWLEVDNKNDLQVYEKCIKENLFRLE